MGTCCSTKKGSSASSSSTSNPVAVATSVPLSSKTQVNPNVSCEKLRALKSTNFENQSKTNLKKEKQQEHESGEGQVKKETFIVNHRKSHEERERNPKTPSGNVSFPNEAAEPVDNKNKKIEGVAVSVPSSSGAAMGVAGVRTSSCTKEEVEAILIQCGRLSRSSSGKAPTPSSRKYSGSKRSYDFDHCDNDKTVSTESNSDLCEDDGKRDQYRQRHRQSPRSSSQGRRRTPSRERDQNQRSTSRERRVSRSPGRRSSETNTIASAGNSNTSAISARPGKMVSVPATVTSIVTDKSNNGGGAGGESATGMKRISVKRTVGGDSGMVGSRTAASPRSKSPARANANTKIVNENQQQQPSLSRSSSRKAEQSPYRRNPLGEIDINSLAYPQAANNGSKFQKKTQKEFEGEANLKQNMEMNGSSRNNRRDVMEKVVKEQLDEKAKGQPSMADNMIAKAVVPSGVEIQKQQTITRSRSSRRSRDLDFNHDAVIDAGNSYTALLLEDIQDFHQKNTSSVSVPACVTKACSILEAVADLNSSTKSNFSYAFSDERRIPPTTPMQQFDRRSDCNLSLGANHVGKRVTDPFVESEVAGCDDLMEPSFHKYVTVRRGGGDMEDQESSGSNSFVASGQQQQRGVSSCSWEPNSADSTDCWSSRLMTKEQDQKTPISLDVEEARRRLTARRECDHEHSGGIGRGRIGTTSKGLQAIPYVTVAAFHTDV